jgi:hypothetical protein
MKELKTEEKAESVSLIKNQSDYFHLNLENIKKNEERHLTETFRVVQNEY